VVRSRHHQPSEAPLGGQRDTTVKTRQTCEGKRYEPAPLPGEEGSDGEGKPYKPAPFMGVTLFSGWRDPRLWSFDAEGSPIHSRCVLGTYYSSLDDPFREPFKHPFLAVLTVLCSEEPFKHPFGWVLTAFPGLESSFVSGARREWVGWCSAVCDAWEAGDGFGRSIGSGYWAAGEIGRARTTVWPAWVVLRGGIPAWCACTIVDNSWWSVQVMFSNEFCWLCFRLALVILQGAMSSLKS
jgi:hypothetical protein